MILLLPNYFYKYTTFNQKATLEQTNKIRLAEKLKEAELKLYASDYVHRRISYHWLYIFKSIKAVGINCEIICLCSVSEEAYPYFVTSINKLNHPELTPGMISIDAPVMMDQLFEKYPSVDAFKYVMDLPVVSSANVEFHEIIQEINLLPDFSEEAVYFISPDWSPTLRLSWKDVAERGGEVFSNIPLAYIFTNASFSKIIFKSLEDEWRVLR